MQSQITKLCRKCDTSKPLDGFYADAKKRDGVHTVCKECVKAAGKRRTASLTSEQRQQRTEYARNYYHRRHSEFRAKYKAAKLRCLNHYGGTCACCGETEPMFLTFDHINDDGAAHRNQDKGTFNIVPWLIRNNFPEGIVQVLCMNCNQGRFMNGGTCPHARSGDS